jgi:hypothetical protein
MRKSCFSLVPLIILLAMCMEGCGAGQFLGPSLTPSPTHTLTPTATDTPRPTFTPTFTPAATSTPAPAGSFPGQTLADAKLQNDVYFYILVFSSGCSQVDVTNTTLVAPLAGGEWTERWSVDSCGTKHVYLISFTELASGGTDFAISQEN